MIKVTLEKGDIKVHIESDKDDVSVIVKAVAEALNPQPAPYYPYLYGLPVGVSDPSQVSWTTRSVLQLNGDAITPEQMEQFKTEWNSRTQLPNCT